MTAYRLLSSPISKAWTAIAFIVFGWSGAAEAAPETFNTALPVAVAEDGTVFAADYGNNRIQKWWSMADMVGQ